MINKKIEEILDLANKIENLTEEDKIYLEGFIDAKRDSN